MKTSRTEQEDGVYIYRMWITTRDGRKIFRRNGRPFRLKIRG